MPPLSPTARRLAQVVAIVAAVLLFATVAVQVRHGNPAWDRDLFFWFHQREVPGDYSDAAGWLARGLTRLGEAPASLLVATVLLVFLAVARRHRVQPQTTRAMVFAVVVPASGSLAANGLKQVFRHPRPDALYHYVPTRSFSFPSGHTATATVVWLTVAVLLARYLTGRAAKVLPLACLVVPLLVGFSRVYLGVHWPTDVVAGLTFGVAWVLTCHLLFFETVPERPSPVSGPRSSDDGA